ncbi:hypothetical protein LIER_23279 [Lithospermum erythrorhizon]|uniref:Uncharacterized protein n=1 Tax=Lithospermum erythrorhizon TaxID=34254 RepID=A0AAV3R0J9_LITER
MDEQGISSVFEDRLNPTLYDYRAYERECPYFPTHATRQGSLTTPSSDSSSSDLDSSLATFPIPQLTITDKWPRKLCLVECLNLFKTMWMNSWLAHGRRQMKGKPLLAGVCR